jgi:hypothetical protein
VDENLDEDMGNDEAGQQQDLEDEGVVTQDLEGQEAANENLEARQTSADDLDEVSDTETIHGFRVERPGGTLQDLKEIIAILRPW